MTYKITFAERLEKTLIKLKAKDQELILQKIEKLKSNPHPEGSIKLKGSKSTNLYRIRAGNYRIIYSVKQQELLIIIVAIGDRKAIYKNY